MKKEISFRDETGEIVVLERRGKCVRMSQRDGFSHETMNLDPTSQMGQKLLKERGYQCDGGGTDLDGTSYAQYVKEAK